MIRHKHRIRKLHRGDAGRVGKGSFYLDEITLLNRRGIVLGNGVGFGAGCWLNGFGGITIEGHTLFGPGCFIHSANHEITGGRVVRNRWVAKPVFIGSHVWIGANVVILPGAHIADGTVVGAGSVVAGRVSGVVHGPKAR